jgi:NADPH2:quinone reductase
MTMKAVVCEAFGGPEVLALREVPDPPQPGPDEVQVRITARGVQYVDVLMLAGKYQFRPEPPFIPGNEGAGEVVAVGPRVAAFKPGDKVMCRQRLGAFAERGNVKAEDCDLVPAAMSLDEAAVFRNVYHTAYHALLQRGRLKAGDRVLIHGAAGGIGLPAIQIAKLYGADVIATASTDEKRAACLEEGADYAIPYHDGFRDRVMELTRNRGVDIVYDPVNGPTFELPRLERAHPDPRLFGRCSGGGAHQLPADQGDRGDRRAYRRAQRDPPRHRPRQHQNPDRARRRRQVEAAHLAALCAGKRGRGGPGAD